MTPVLPASKEIYLPLTKVVITAHIIESEKETDHYVFEGEVEMSTDQNAYYKQIIGDGMAKVTVSKELSEKNFGNGGSTMVSITLTCDQSYSGITSAVPLANQLVEYYTAKHFDEVRSLIGQKGIHG